MRGVGSGTMIASRRRLAAEVNLGELGSSVQSLRVCLVRTPTLTNVDAVGQDAVPPIGLAYVAGALHAGGHKVTVVDAVGEALHQYSRADWSDGHSCTVCNSTRSFGEFHKTPRSSVSRACSRLNGLSRVTCLNAFARARCLLQTL